MMNRTLVIILLAAALVAGCSRKAQPAGARPQANADMQTIDSANVRPAPINPPPMLTDEAPPLKQLNIVAQADAPPPPTPQDEALRASLPFSPAIAMDPVDGSKISIRASIPTLEYKNKLYYFATEDHKRAFQANPEQYTKGLFSHL
ncbi:MAG TPA: YHS domain-containing protein [Thermoanaerobaculia bacterium]|nr:YHS domain-containing protein [Thermoanaerobaculia bacterium]